MARRQETSTIATVYLPELRREIDAALDRCSRFGSESPTRLTDAVRYSLLAPGKRLRPTLVLVAAELCGAARADAIPAAVALEAVHSYSLIHDDLPAMDDDDLRRGRPTCHRRFDEATAILAGDALLTFAFEALTANLADSTVAARCVLELARAAGPCGMVGGQTDDVLWGATISKTPGATDLFASVLGTFVESQNGVAPQNKASDSQENETSVAPIPIGRNERLLLTPFLRKIHRRKTGALIVAALKLGAIVAGATALQRNRLEIFGRNLGEAFQIADDILDETGDEAQMGKRLRKDEEAGKLTFVSLFGLDESRRLLAARVENAKRALNPEFVAEFDSDVAESDAKSTDASSTFPLFAVESLPFGALTYLADYVAERSR